MRKTARRCAEAAVLAGTLATLAGCASLADRIVQPPAKGSMLSGAVRDAMERGNGIVRSVVTARGGNRIVYRMVPPADYGMHYAVSRHLLANGRGNVSFSFSVPGHPQPVPARGTVVLLHGWGDDHTTMLPWALALARHGYAGVLPDLRNHGESDRAPAGYGPREAQDVVDLLAAMRTRGELKGPVFLLGESLGADVAVMAAADPSARVDGVIAMEPFVTAGRGIRAMIRYLGRDAVARAGPGAGLAAQAQDAKALDAAVVEANHRLGLDLDGVDIGPLLRGTTTCTLLVQGAHDVVFDSSDLRAYADAPQVRYLELSRENHLSLPLRADWLGDAFATWIDHAQACPAPALPPDPLDAAPVGASPAAAIRPVPWPG